MRIYALTTLASSLILGAFGSSGCRLNPDCFASDECRAGLVCAEGRCLDPASLPPDAGTVEITWWSHVQPIMAANCVGCHSDPPTNQATVPLVSYADSQRPAVLGGLVYQAMAARVEDLQAPMPPLGQPRLSRNQIEIITRWAARGAPEGPRPGTNDGGVDGEGPATSPIMGLMPPAPVSSGYQHLDGPAWDPANGVLFFSDSIRSIIYQLTPPNTVIEIRQNSGGAAGLGIHPMGMVAAEQQNRAVTMNGGIAGPQPIAQLFQGRFLNSPNDVVVRRDGTIYFTDPAFGLVGQREIDVNGLYRISPTGDLTREWDGLDTSGPSGLALSPDGNTLYMADTVEDTIRAFSLGLDGRVAAERVFALCGDEPDGLAVDAAGNVYVAIRAGIEVWSPTGERWGMMPMSQQPTNLEFGGAERNILYITTRGTLFALQVRVPGPS